MKVIEENDHEIYVELEPEDMPFTIDITCKKLYFRMKGQEFIRKVDLNEVSVLSRPIYVGNL